MTEHSQPPAGKISVHGNGLGAPSPEEVERRAREIAMIDERNPDEFTEADWKQARHELMGAENNTPPEETPDNADLTEEWNVVESSKGHRAPRPGTEEEETVGEHCVIDGLEEATHDQMLEARREELDQDGDILCAQLPRNPPPIRSRSNQPIFIRAWDVLSAFLLVFIKSETSQPVSVRV